LAQCCEKEKHVEEKLELIVKNFWYKGYDIVFGVFYKVGMIILRLDFSIKFDYSVTILYFSKEELFKALQFGSFSICLADGLFASGCRSSC